MSCSSSDSTCCRPSRSTGSLSKPHADSPLPSAHPHGSSPTRLSRTFHRRPLPADSCVALSGREGRALFNEALGAGDMECFLPLIEHFHTQSDPAFCGLGALTMVLNALQIDPGRTWKGPWRWFDESLLDCCAPLDVVRAEGITLANAHCLAQCNGATSRLQYGDRVPLQAFREDVRRVTSASPAPPSFSPPGTSGATAKRGELVVGGKEVAKGHSEGGGGFGGEFMLCAYSRAALGQTGDGHFSPVGGYHAGRDLVLILDVARFKYPPHWVPLPLLHAALQPPDPSTGTARGYLLLGRHPGSAAWLFTLDPDRFGDWACLRDWLLAQHWEEAQTSMRGGGRVGEGGRAPHFDLTEDSFRRFLETLPERVASLVVPYPYLKCSSRLSAPADSSASLDDTDQSGDAERMGARNSTTSGAEGSGREGGGHNRDAFLEALVDAIEKHPAFSMVPARGAWQQNQGDQCEGKRGGGGERKGGYCSPAVSVDERHASVVLFLALAMWAEEGRGATAATPPPSPSPQEPSPRLRPRPGWRWEDSALAREVRQLKVRLQALARGMGSVQGQGA